jgi:hypothetical protein
LAHQSQIRLLLHLDGLVGLPALKFPPQTSMTRWQPLHDIDGSLQWNT